MRARFASIAVLVVSLCAVGTARAAGPDAATTQTAVQLADEAAELFKAAKYDEALDRYEKAFALVRRHTLGVRIARCLEKLGRLNEAAERYLTVSRMPLPPDLDEDKAAKQREAMLQAAQEREALLPRIPALVLNVKGPESATVLIDKQPVPHALFGVKRVADPGAHHIEAHNGDEVVTRDVTLKEGDVQSVDIELRAPPPAPKEAETPAQPADARPARAPSSTLRTVGFVGIGVGAAGVVFGAITGGMALGGKDSLTNSGCGTDLRTCPSNVADQVSTYNAERIMSSTGFIVGGVLAVAGVVLVLVAPKSAVVTAFVRPGGFGFGGSF
jgi:hypothetical protein